MKHILKILTMLLLASCGSKDTAVVDQNQKTTIPNPVKSLKLSTRSYGQEILDGKIRPSDDAETFACLDSINNPNPSTRKFFFEVYVAISRNADGALSEVIGGYTRPYLKNFTKEAIANFEKLSLKDQEIFINNLAYEFSMNDDFKASIHKYFATISRTCTDCKRYASALQSLRKRILESAARIEK